MLEQSPSSGKTTAIASFGTGQAIVLLLYIVHKFGIDDMTPEVAAAIIGFAATVVAVFMHKSQRKQEATNGNSPTPPTQLGATP